MLVRPAYLGITNAFALLRLLPGSDRDKDAEILALRRQLAVLQRQLGEQRGLAGDLLAHAELFVQSEALLGVSIGIGEPAGSGSQHPVDPRDTSAAEPFAAPLTRRRPFNKAKELAARSDPCRRGSRDRNDRA